ncbi:MAG TPA: S9 family peptidase [Bacteroides sp.]|nr:S9 family peptidase [Bacteroides sp.]
MKYFPRIILATALLLSTILPSNAQDKKALTVTDMMKFRHIESPSISNDGNWVAHTSKPDRGDPEVFIYSTDGKKKYTIPQGEKPVISNDGKWVAAVHQVPAEDLVIKNPAKGGIRPKAGLALLNTSTGELSIYKNIQAFTFSNDSKWLVYLALKEEEDESATKNGEEKKDPPKTLGTDLYMISLEDESYETLSFVTKFSIDSTSDYMAIARVDSNGEGNGVYIVDFGGDITNPSQVYSDSNAWADYFKWNNLGGQLAFLAGIMDKKQKRTDTELFLWEPGDEKAEVILDDGDLHEEWKLYNKNRLRWTLDGKRLFLGIKPSSEIIKPDEKKNDSVSKVFDTEAILSDKAVDVWHWNDPFINSHQKKMWAREKDRTYMAVYNLETQQLTSLADKEMPDLRLTDCPTTLLGSSNLPYAKRVTWDGRFYDYYLVNLQTGAKTLALSGQEHTVSLSPDGKFMVYYRAGDWHLMETITLKSKNLTGSLDVSFADEDWDYPEDVPGYRVGGWTEGSASVLIYDKYDIWQFPIMSGEPVCLTEGKGRNEKLQFRLKRLDVPGGSSGYGRSSSGSQEPLKTGESVFLSAYHDMKKYTAVYSMKIGIPGVTRILEDPKKYTLIAQAEENDRIIFSRESYTEFPDLWVTNKYFKKPRKLSDANPRIDEFAWGEAELVEWTTEDGTPVQGILIKPGNYKAGEKYPVLVYYYRFFTNRMYDFNEVVVNHRPCFPFYASNGYAVFLPDIRFDIGNPGSSATKCLVPGVQKIIDLGVADPDAICLHGHSWSGYQTAFVVTQTDMFACAIAGAPVSNMTSAYSGIRWETGLARQFQYEKSQSRIGATLWEARDKYIDNSPVFFADRINTPLLIQFGDADGAVPWYQGIELYLAMRRLEKDCVFLQYRKEPHHLKQYANKLDYTLKFKAYLDHYLKGEPAPEWISTGVPYKGK